MNHPNFIWYTYAERIFGRIADAPGVSLQQPASKIISQESYDNYVLRDNPEIGCSNPYYVEMLLDEQSDGRRGLLALNGNSNIFFFTGREKNKKFALRATYPSSGYGKSNVWGLVITEVPIVTEGGWYNWGAYRSAGTQYCWDYAFERKNNLK